MNSNCFDVGYYALITLNDYLKKTYGEKVYKVALNAGCSCPNRDGSIGYGGCIFCSKMGSGNFAQDENLSVTEQIERGKSLVKAKGANKYIAYFQAFTNTYAPTDYLRSIYYEAVSHPDIVAVSIATRPDCLPKEVLSLLSEINSIKPVWVELGLQTIHSKTAELIRRGYDLCVYDEALKNLSDIGISQIITHVILGLPYETKEEMLETVRYVADSKSNGIKLQLLHVLKNTDLATMYGQGLFEVLSMEESVDIVAECIKCLPPDMVVHRMTGDGDKKELIAPMWSTDKKRVLNAIHEALK